MQKKWLQKKLGQIQRGYLLRIIRGYRTISTEAAQVVAGIEPLFLTCELRASISNLKRGRRIPEYVSSFQLQETVNLTKLGHPALHQMYFKDSCEIGNHHYSVFTDGSRTEDPASGVIKVGCAFVVYEHSSECASSLFRLSPQCSVFQAELFAIKEAVTWCNSQGSSACISSDSQSALQAINDKYSTNELVSEIRSLIFGNVNHICLCWVRGHTGIIGNERADELAKSAADSTLPYAYNLCPISFLVLFLF